MIRTRNYEVFEKDMLFELDYFRSICLASKCLSDALEKSNITPIELCRQLHLNEKDSTQLQKLIYEPYMIQEPLKDSFDWLLLQIDRIKSSKTLEIEYNVLNSTRLFSNWQWASERIQTIVSLRKICDQKNLPVIRFTEAFLIWKKFIYGVNFRSSRKTIKEKMVGEDWEQYFNETWQGGLF